MSRPCSELPPIVIVGLGPGDAGRRTVVVQSALDAADRILARTLQPPGLDDLATDPRVQDLSSMVLALPANTMDWASGARIACDLAAQGVHVVVAVPGHPLYGERLVLETLAEAKRRGLLIVIHEGLSTLDLVSTALQIDAMVEEVQIVDAAAEVHRIGSNEFGGGLFPFSPHRSMVISRVYTREVMRGIQRLLLRILPGSHPITLLDAAGLSTDEASRFVTLNDLADEVGGYRLSLFVPSLDPLVGGRDPHAMQQISARLRRSDGCPWDRVQTHASLIESFLDEVYEAVDAIESGDMPNLAEELGDLFLHIVLQAQIAEEAGEFTLEDVYEGVAAKIVRRHPHVFAGEHAETEEDLSRIWRRVKMEEKATAVHSKPEKDFDGESRSRPALGRATKLLGAKPVATDRRYRSAGDRANDLLRAVTAIVQAGDDPEQVLKAALESHASSTKATASAPTEAPERTI